MNFKRRLCLCLALLCVLWCSGAAAAVEVDCDSSYCFTGADFGGDEVLCGVCITGLPDRDAGTVLLGSRVVRSGDILSADQLEQLTFQPLRTQEDLQVTVVYLPIYENRVAPAATMTISIRGKEDLAPVAEDSVLETYKNLPNQGMLKASDPEGSSLQYTLLRGPKRGDVKLEADGRFTYTPKKNKVGTDSFTYTVTDETGNVSREATVTIRVMKPVDKTFYTDTVGSDCRFAAEWMKNTGLFVGEQLGGSACFQPEKTVSRGEFVVMLIKSLGIPVEEDASYTGFEDPAPGWLKPYLAAAYRAGLTAGWKDGRFAPQEPITGAEAALMLQYALDLPAAAMADADETDRALAVLAEHELVLDGQAVLTRAEAAKLLYRASILAQIAPGMQVIAGN